MLQSSFQSESPRSASVQLHMDVLESHQLLNSLHHGFCAFRSVRSPCNHDPTSSRLPETPGMRGQAVGWPMMMGFPLTFREGSAWDWRADLSGRWNGQLEQRVALNWPIKLYQGQNFNRALHCPLYVCLGKLRKVGRYQLLGHNFQTTTAIIYMKAGQEPLNGFSSKASVNWNVTVVRCLHRHQL